MLLAPALPHCKVCKIAEMGFRIIIGATKPEKSKLLVQCVGTAAVERTHAEEPRGTTTKAAVVNGVR